MFKLMLTRYIYLQILLSPLHRFRFKRITGLRWKSLLKDSFTFHFCIPKNFNSFIYLIKTLGFINKP